MEPNRCLQHKSLPFPEKEFHPAEEEMTFKSNSKKFIEKYFLSKDRKLQKVVAIISIICINSLKVRRMSVKSSASRDFTSLVVHSCSKDGGFDASSPSSVAASLRRCSKSGTTLSSNRHLYNLLAYTTCSRSSQKTITRMFFSTRCLKYINISCKNIIRIEKTKRNYLCCSVIAICKRYS